MSLRGRIDRALTLDGLRARLQEIILHKPKRSKDTATAGDGR
jgi:hypothetical protein